MAEFGDTNDKVTPLRRPNADINRADPLKDLITRHGTTIMYEPLDKANIDLCKGRISAAELQRHVFPPVKWAIDGLLPEGLTLIAGKPKMGKSYLMLNAGVAIASGGCAFSKANVEAGDVLMAALEDPPRRLHDRLSRLIGRSSWPARLNFRVRMPRLNEGGLEMLSNFIENAPNPRLIVIDTLELVRSRSGGRSSQYTDDYDALVPLQRLAAEKRVAIAAIHHLRKMSADDPFDEVSGTTGLTGAADSVLVLRRESGRADAILYGRGRDLPEFEHAFDFDQRTGLWRHLGDADAYRHSEERCAILELLRAASEPMTPAAIAAALGDGEMSADAVRKMLSRMGDGLVKKVGHGKYCAA